MFNNKALTNSGKHKYAIIVFCLLLFNSILAHADIVLNFGIYTSDKPSEMVKKFRPVLNVLEAGLSRLLDDPVIINLQVASSYQKGVAALVTGEVDFARFGPASYIIAKSQDPRISIIAIESKNGSKIFNGVICVRMDSTITRVEDLKGKNFAFGDPQSTIGRYLSQAYLYEYGVTANELSSYEYLGRHDRVGSAVAAGKFDAGALKKDGFLVGSDEDYDRIRKAIENNPRFFE